MSTLGESGLSSVHLYVPRYGIPSAHLLTADDNPPTGRTTLTVADLVIPCAVIPDRTFVRKGITALRVVGGAGGWRRTAPPDGANRRAGVLLSTLATTLAAVVGETVRLDGAVDRVLSTTVARWGDTAAAALTSLCASPSGSTPVPWYVGLDGITVLGTRTGAAVEADPLDGPVGRTYLFGDDAPLLALLPGATIDGRVIISLRVTADADKVRAEAVVS